MAENKDIVAALHQLDMSNDDHWTDDGLPRVDVIRTLAKDPNVKRNEISAALPGFTRTGSEPSEPTDVLKGEISAEDEEAALKAANAPAPADDHSDDLLLDPEDLKALMKRRLDDAETNIAKCKIALQESFNVLRRAEAAHRKALSDYVRRFPPMSQADSIKEHLERTQEHRAGARSQIDQAMSIRGKTGWGRRPANGLPAQIRLGV